MRPWRSSLTDRRPTRATIDGRAYLDLQNLARRQRRPTDELHQLYALEGFLCRLTASEYAERFTLKGGVLMAAFDARRPTRDIDLHARALSNDEAAVLQVIREVAGRPLDDGLFIDTDTARAEPIRDESDYSGVRVSLAGRLSIARIAFHVISGIELHESITAVATHRRVPLQTLQVTLRGYAVLAQSRWAAWLRRQHLADRVPDDFAEVVDLVTRFADPVLSGQATNLLWQPAQRAWR